jgi:peptidoglycan hydrolase FlgJ
MFDPAKSVTTPVNPLPVLSGLDTTNKSKVRATAEGSEATFLNNMLQSMFTGLEDGGTWGSGDGAEAWRGMLINEYAQSISKSGGIGIADAVERELLALQEANQ